jgi:phosphate transport system protein
LARLDVEKAVEVAQGDDELDQEFQSALRRLITYMMEDPRTIGQAISVIFIVKALERIGDHSKNIAEYIIYLVKGKDVRHVSMDVLVQDALKEE